MAERLTNSRKVELALYLTTGLVVLLTMFCVFVLIAGTSSSRARQKREAMALAESRCVNFVNHAAIETTLIQIAEQGGLPNVPEPNLIASDAVRKACDEVGVELEVHRRTGH